MPKELSYGPRRLASEGMSSAKVEGPPLGSSLEGHGLAEMASIGLFAKAKRDEADLF
jgi:hypothetical protein